MHRVFHLILSAEILSGLLAFREDIPNDKYWKEDALKIYFYSRLCQGHLCLFESFLEESNNVCRKYFWNVTREANISDGIS